jgi:aminoglycoside phosphotransferase (APT) family kinase protein
VFRFPKRADVEQQLLRELEVLPTIARHAPVPVPEYQFVGRPSGLFPRHFGGYAILPGVPAHLLALDLTELARMAPQIGGFLSGLHGADVNALRSPLPVSSISEVLGEARADAMGELEKLERVMPGGLSPRWRTYVEQGAAVDSPSDAVVLVHGDLAAEHFLVERGTLSGVIDWSELAISSPALDLAALLHWGGDALADEALKFYPRPITTTTLEQARYIAVCRAVLDVAFGLETGRAEYIAGALRALRMNLPSPRLS